MRLPLLAILSLLACSEATTEPLLLLDCDPAVDPCCSPLSLDDEECGAEPPTPDGWDAAPGSGAAFIVGSFALAGRNQGADLDGTCDEEGCIDNALSSFGQLVNDQLRQALLGGESLMLIEIAGLVPEYRGWDSSVTVNLYSARDADDPFFPANNFEVPDGHTTCCEFLISPYSLSAGGGPVARIPARIRDGRLETVGPASIAIPVTLGEPPHEVLVFERAVITAEVPVGLEELKVGSLAGALTVASAAGLCNPYCKTVSPRCPVMQRSDSTFVDLFTSFGIEPDIDLDRNGLECVLDTDGDGAIDRCCERCDGSLCTGEEIPPVDPNSPSSCAKQVADGYSASFEWTAVDATIVGIAPP